MGLLSLTRQFVIELKKNSDFFVCKNSFLAHFNSWNVNKLDSLSDSLLYHCVHFISVFLEYTFQKLFYTYKQRNDTYMYYESVSFCL